MECARLSTAIFRQNIVWRVGLYRRFLSSERRRQRRATDALLARRPVTTSTITAPQQQRVPRLTSATPISFSSRTRRFCWTRVDSPFMSRADAAASIERVCLFLLVVLGMPND